MINAENNYKVSNKKQTKALEKLSSGYRINRAADDASGLQISEKMRYQIRGLNQGKDNAQDGISLVQTGDGALGEVQAMIHRMKELTVKSLNDTNTAADRATIEAEFDSLQSEIDRIMETTEFNNSRIFSEHKPTYYQFEGNIEWAPSQLHTITAGSDSLVVECMEEDGGSREKIKVTVPAGTYTTQELIDELEDALIQSGATEKGINVELTKEGTCNVNYEGGVLIENVGGDLAYLLYDVYEGSSMGALIGTTAFPSEYSRLEISSQNNNLTFDIEGVNGNKQQISMTIPDGRYTRQELIDILNQKLSGTTVSAVASGSGIKLISDDSFITGFKGNMFKIDEEGKEEVYTSVFYDNVKYGYITAKSASFTGGAVITNETQDTEHNHFTIDSSNRELVVQPNGAENPTTLTIPEGEYTVGEMAEKLNELFQGNNLDLKASSYTKNGFSGLTITSQVKGVTSRVGIDSNSSAYDTLFVKRVYDEVTKSAVLSNETVKDKDGGFFGTKEFTGANQSITVQQGVNDSFKLNLDGVEYTIKLAAGTYNGATAVVDEINRQLNGSQAPIGYKDKLKAVVENNKITLKGTAGCGVVSIKASADGSNTGYKDIFVGIEKNTTWPSLSASGTATTPPSLTTNTDVKEPAALDSANNKITINYNGNQQTVTLPTGNQVTHKDIENAIENAFPETTTVSNRDFGTVKGQGTERDNNFSCSGNGKSNVSNRKYSSVGSSSSSQGVAGVYKNNVAANTAITSAMGKDVYNITADTNTLCLNLNGVEKLIKITEGNYTASGIVAQLQKEIDAAYGNSFGGAEVSLDASGQIALKARLLYPDGVTQADGKWTSISCDTYGSSLLKELNTTRTAAKITTKELQDSIEITDETASFVFDYTEKGKAQSVTLQLQPGTYTREQLKTQINQQLLGKGIEVEASLEGKKLCLQTKNSGEGYALSYKTTDGGTSADALFGEMTTKNAAKGTTGLTAQVPIKIDDASNQFNMTVNGKDYKLQLDNGTYATTADFVGMLNQKFKDAGAGIKATCSGNIISYETEKKGKDASFELTYKNGGSSMKAIYGESKVTTPGIDASFNGDRLVLTGTQNGGNISIPQGQGSIFYEPLTTYEEKQPTEKQGYYSTKHGYIDGADLTEPVVIDQWNNELSFVYTENGTQTGISFTVPDGTYTFDTLKDKLQELIDAKTGNGKIKVTADSGGVRLETSGVGSNYSLGSFKNDFYRNVLCNTTERNNALRPENKNGTQSNDLAFTVGRKDVKNGTTELKAGITDTLSFDFTYGGKVHKITMDLTPGVYNGTTLVSEIQGKLNEQLKNMGLEENTIEVGIGGVNSGVNGSNDDNALVFKLSSTVRLPAEGEYIIDGVSGNAAFAVFYQTEGDLKEAYVKGCKDITEGVTLEKGEDQLGFSIDGTEYTISLPEGEYTTDEILDEINDQLKAGGVPAVAELEGENLLIHYKTVGMHKITDVTGSAKQKLFFSENGAKKSVEGLKLQLSSKISDYEEIDKYIVNTVTLGINSITVSAPKYAEKALGRLDDALNQVSRIRSRLGGKQNQLEYAIQVNQNEAENTQSAESVIRDADMSEEIINYSVSNILRQAAQSVMAQASKMEEGVLRLLE